MQTHLLRLVVAASVMFGTLALGLPAVGEETAAVVPATTLENLQAAYEGESNAHARYIAFAKKADEEGYLGVASLFRAAARAEEIHAQSHAKVIKGLGAEPKADVKDPEVKTTAENLKVAIEGESHERDSMYPAFIAKAKADGNRAAVRSCNYALEAESEHAKLYQDALDNLDRWKAGPKEFLVCSVCGYTALAVALDECPVCSTPREEILSVK